MGSLLFLFLPGFGFVSGLWVLYGRPGFGWIAHPGDYPWQLWGIALGGILAILGGFLDWRFHRSQGVIIGPKERRYEFVALSLGGFPLFLLMGAASISPRPQIFLLPVLVILLFTTGMICYDEFVFHRKRCGPYETILHRMLVFGNGAAFLVWAHWCFVQGGVHAAG
jgi:hypothetical protein